MPRNTSNPPDLAAEADVAMTALTTDLRERFGAAVRENVPVAPFTSARIGGPADLLVDVRSADELADAVKLTWNHNASYCILGGGSNLLVSDAGIRGLVILNRAKDVHFAADGRSVWAESGVVLTSLANRCAEKGLAGLEWAATVPGTLGGAVHGNAGAFGGDMAGSLTEAGLITPHGRRTILAGELGFGYRTSVLKRRELKAVVLTCTFGLRLDSRAAVEERIQSHVNARKAAQPPGASMGSMFKNPPGDYAGRLIEAAGLKGMQVGGAAISALHGNFFVNHGQATAHDVRELIDLAREQVLKKSGVQLELEIELVGAW